MPGRNPPWLVTAATSTHRRPERVRETGRRDTIAVLLARHQTRLSGRVMHQPHFTPPADWMSHGACRGADPELFFPVRELGPSPRKIEQAKAICGRCPVRLACLSYAADTRQHGIWGGTTDDERRAMLAAARRNAACASRRERARDELRLRPSRRPRTRDVRTGQGGHFEQQPAASAGRCPQTVPGSGAGSQPVTAASAAERTASPGMPGIAAPPSSAPAGQRGSGYPRLGRRARSPGPGRPAADVAAISRYVLCWPRSVPAP